MTEGDNPRARELLRTLSAQGFQRDRTDTERIRYTGMLRAANRDISVAITFADLEFTRLPKLTLLAPEKEAPHVVAHLGTSGAFCFAQDGDIVLDRYNVGGTALQCLELARRGLERALAHGYLEEDIAREFPQHWQGAPFFYDIVSDKHTRAHLYTVPRSRGNKCFVLSDRSKVVRPLVSDDAQVESVIAAAIPAYVVKSATELTFVKEQRQPCDLSEFLDWLDHCAPNLRDRAIIELCRQFPGPLVALFVWADNGCVGVAVRQAGTLFKAITRRQGLVKVARQSPAKLRVDRWSGTPMDLGYILNRNMDSTKPLCGRRIALVGCGTIGSHLAKLLVQSGAGYDNGSLRLLDNQLLEPANLGRHYLGMNRIGEYKSIAMKQELSRLFPEANIVAVQGDATRHIESLATHDLIIDATGEEALSVSINHHLIERRSCGGILPALFVRLFGNGAAAQCLTVDSEKHACFKCLRPDQSQDWRFNPMKSDALTATTVAACGEGPYVAYSVSAPIIAAGLALQATLDWHNGSAAPRLRTIRVDKQSTKDVVDKNPPRSKHCPACGENC